MPHIYPIDTTRKEIYQKKVWGNSKELEMIMGPLPACYAQETIGEIFLASTHPDGPSAFADGTRFDTMIASEKCKRTFGHGVYGYGEFPLLLKILSATQSLSIQTHYANKVEAWYALSDGEMLYGLTAEGEKMVVRAEGRKTLGELLHRTSDVETLARYFNYVTFKKGEAYVIHAGMVHALLSGTVFEPQKNSNLTNRGGDWGRNQPDRPLHLKEFFESLYPFAITPTPIKRVVCDDSAGATMHYVFATSHFVVQELHVRTSYDFAGSRHRFVIGFCIEGIVEITHGKRHFSAVSGSVFLIPAEDAVWHHAGSGTILYTFVARLLEDVILPLINQGIAREEIIQLGGVIPKENDLYIEMKEHGLV